MNIKLFFVYYYLHNILKIKDLTIIGMTFIKLLNFEQVFTPIQCLIPFDANMFYYFDDWGTTHPHASYKNLYL